MTDKYPKGTKVEALVGYDDKNAWFLGEGIYQGEDSPGWLGGHPAEKITLINGDVIYDCECLWGTVGSLRKLLDGKAIHRVRVIRDTKGVFRGYKDDESVPAIPVVDLPAAIPEALVETAEEAVKAMAPPSLKETFLEKLGIKK